MDFENLNFKNSKYLAAISLKPIIIFLLISNQFYTPELETL